MLLLDQDSLEMSTWRLVSGGKSQRMWSSRVDYRSCATQNANFAMIDVFNSMDDANKEDRRGTKVANRILHVFNSELREDWRDTRTVIINPRQSMLMFNDGAPRFECLTRRAITFMNIVKLLGKMLRLDAHL